LKFKSHCIAVLFKLQNVCIIMLVHYNASKFSMLFKLQNVHIIMLVHYNASKFSVLFKIQKCIYNYVCALQNASKFSEVGGDIQMHPLQCINRFK
jgi:hypothetical protein